MSFMFFLLVIGIVFTWLVVRSVRAGYGKLLFWLVWFIVGICFALSQEQPVSPGGVLLWLVWAGSVFVMPLWWLFQWIRRGARPVVK